MYLEVLLDLGREHVAGQLLVEGDSRGPGHHSADVDLLQRLVQFLEVLELQLLGALLAKQERLGLPGGAACSSPGSSASGWR